MRHDPAVAALVIMLRQLKMHGMAQAVGELAEQGAPAFEAAQPVLAQLLKAETAEREVRSVAYQLKHARFPAYRDLTGFDFAYSDVNEALVRQLHRCEFLEQAHNVVMVGGPGTGKTHLATALGVQAVEHQHRRVRFYSTIELVNALELEKAAGKSGQLANRLMYADMVILDELGYLPFSASGGALLFHLLSKLYERSSSPQGTLMASHLKTLIQQAHRLGDLEATMLAKAPKEMVPTCLALSTPDPSSLTEPIVEPSRQARSYIEQNLHKSISTPAISRALETPHSALEGLRR
jgi:DNA replication protein DnaC